MQITRARAAAHHPAGASDPDRISFTVTLRTITRTIMTTATAMRHALAAIHHHRLIDRRDRRKPRALAGSQQLANGPKTHPRTPMITGPNA